MCIAGLNVSTRPCHHRWYRLTSPCHPTANLSNCPERLRLAGWEVRNDNCPWCDSDETISDSTHRLFGGALSTNSSTSAASIMSPDLAGNFGAFNSKRRASSASLTPLSRYNSSSSVESERAHKHRKMNDRLHHYLNNNPHDVLPSARKNYPTRPPSIVKEAPKSDHSSLRSAKGKLTKTWRRSVGLGRDVFSFRI